MHSQLSRPGEADRTITVRRHLDRVLGSAAFRSSRRCQDFLRYVVEETLEGRDGAIKERTIATAVFGKDDRYEPSEDAIVRVKAVEVRKRLAQFYAAEPPDGTVIALRPGSYVPVFQHEAAPAPASEPEPPPPPPASPGRRWALAGVAVALLLFAAGILVGSLGFRGERPGAAPAALGPSVERLWRPFLASSRPVLIGVPSPDVYTLGGGSLRRLQAHPADAFLVRPEDVSRRRTYWVGLGAVHGAAAFAGLLGGQGRGFTLKTHSEITFTDLRSQPSLLLGGSTSPWARELTRRLRYRFAFEQGEWSIVDTATPRRRWARTSRTDDNDVTEDFALLSRVRDESTGHVYLDAAGLTPRGTQAAVEFVTREELLAPFAADAPADWGERNFQIVIHCQVHERAPGRPKVLAFSVW